MTHFLGVKGTAPRGILMVLGLVFSITTVQAKDTIKVGVLHSLSGTMAISETTLKDTVLMMVDDINKKKRRASWEKGGGGRR